jgi:hypothetical protein
VRWFERFRPAVVKSGIARRKLRAASRYDVYQTVMDIEAAAERRRLTETDAYALLQRAIREGRPFLLGRPGSFEAKTVNEYLDFRAHRTNPPPYGQSTWRRIAASGGFPLETPEEIDTFASDYVHAVLQADVVAIWKSGVIGTGELLRRGAEFIDLGPTNPFGAMLRNVEPWTMALEGRRVLVIHPFRESILAQFRRREEVTTIQRLWPTCSLDVLVPPQTYAGRTDESSRGWTGNMQGLMEAVTEREFDVAIIGAGPYGLPIGAFIKRLGRVALHLGGTTQLLFAIRGKRWEQYENYASAMDENWVRPSAAETPPGAASFEQTPYW